ncbi:MAG: GNAT family N-acetyltransferase, partial [Oscillospiraceae bacterium]
MELWLDTNISAHSFIESEYWKSNYDTVKSMMPSATIYVYEENHVIQGFIGLMDAYIAGIFVSQKFQSKGIG